MDVARVSDVFGLGVGQGGLDFVDVDVYEDVPVFIDPAAIRAQKGDWADECKKSLKSFFRELLRAIGKGDKSRIAALILPLVEPNETHLGTSEGQSKGRGLGNSATAAALTDSLATSKAARTGLLKDLEETALFVDGIDRDIISDITTSVIRRQLVEYTQKMCKFYDIPTELQDSGPMWDTEAREWISSDVELPRGEDNKLILVPKSIVRAALTLDRGKYYRGYLRPYFEHAILASHSPNAALVRVLKDKTLVINRKALDKSLGTTKSQIADNTEEYPQAVKDYRKAVSKAPNPPPSDDELHARIGTPRVDVKAMFDQITAITPGNAGANLYHRSVAELLRALFDLSLANYRIEKQIHGDLKRIDIYADNVDQNPGSFFNWVGIHHNAASIPIECKNYGKEVGNPEVDQIAMRLSTDRGRLGLLVCRSLEKRKRALKRAKTVTDDGHGYVLILEDSDLGEMVEKYIAHHDAFEVGPVQYPELRTQFDALIGA